MQNLTERLEEATDDAHANRDALNRSRLVEQQLLLQLEVLLCVHERTNAMLSSRIPQDQQARLLYGRAC